MEDLFKKRFVTKRRTTHLHPRCIFETKCPGKLFLNKLAQDVRWEELHRSWTNLFKKISPGETRGEKPRKRKIIQTSALITFDKLTLPFILEKETSLKNKVCLLRQTLKNNRTRQFAARGQFSRIQKITL